MLIGGTYRGGNYYGYISPVTLDPYFNSVSLLLPGNGTNNATNNTFLDSSTNNFTITRNGNPTQGTYSPYSPAGWSAYFDGTGDYLTCASTITISIGSGNFSIEFWVNFSAIGSRQDIFCGFSGAYVIYLNSNNKIAFYDISVDLLTSTTTISKDTWYHIAITRQSNTARLFINGTAESTASSSRNFSSVYNIGNNIQTGGYLLNGYLSNFRVVSGTAVYTSNFTPPTAPLTAISGTSFLTCQSNRFVDNSTNALAITANGDVKITNWVPFAPTAAYSAATYGGSAYFDGTGDYLTAPDNAAFSLMSGDFTIESWFYLTATPNPTYGAPIVCKNGVSSGWLVRAYSNRMSWVYVGTTEYLWGPTVNLLNCWYHVAVVKSGSTITGYLNGVGYTITTNIASETSETVKIGSDGYGFTTGFISDVRIIKGTAVYTSNFTPPTVPVTAISGTSLLLNATNAAITDVATRNVLETVGSTANSVKISTAVSKWGGSSIQFDGASGRLTAPSAPYLQLGSSNFTIEGWIYFNSSLGTSNNWTVVAKGTEYALYGDANRWVLQLSGTNNIFVISWAKTYDIWYHFACVRNDATTTMYINGVSIGSGTSSNITDGNNALTIGYYPNANFFLKGNINDLRITRGLARYTTNFTPPVAAFPVQ